MNSVRKRNFFLLIVGRLISLVGSGIQMIAMPLCILDLTSSGTLMGIFMMLSMVPLLLVSPFAGVLGDGLNRKYIAVYTDLGRGTIVFILAWLAFHNQMNVTILFTGQVFISILDSFFNAATDAMLPDLIDNDELNRANASKSAIDCLAMIIGPVLGGIIYGYAGINMIFFLNAVLFILSALCELCIKYQMEIHNQIITFRSFLTKNLDVMAFINRYKGLKQLSVFVMMVNFIAAPLLMVVFPYILKKGIGFNPRQYGYLMTAFVAGVLIGNLLIGSIFAKTSTRSLIKFHSM